MSLPSRKLRHSNRKKSPLGRLLTLGVIVFGSIFVLFIIYELFLAQKGGNADGLRIVQSSQSDGQASGESTAPPLPEAVPVSAAVTESADKPQAEEKSAQDEKSATEEKTAAQEKPAAEDKPAVEQGAQQQTNQTQTAAATNLQPAQPKPAEVTPASTPQTSTPTQASPATASPAKSAPAPEKPTQTAKNEKPELESIRHVVQKGETLIQLSRKYYGNQSSVNKIAVYNGLSPENALPVGRVLYIPVTK